MSRSVLRTDAVRQVQWRPVQALWLWDTDFVMMWHSGVNAAFCTLFNGSGKALHKVLAVADSISLPMLA